MKKKNENKSRKNKKQKFSPSLTRDKFLLFTRFGDKVLQTSKKRKIQKSKTNVVP